VYKVQEKAATGKWIALMSLWRSLIIIPIAIHTARPLSTTCSSKKATRYPISNLAAATMANLLIQLEVWRQGNLSSSLKKYRPYLTQYSRTLFEATSDILANNFWVRNNVP